MVGGVARHRRRIFTQRGSAQPQVYVTQPTTFEVALVLTDGSSCSSQITLIPIEEPSLDLQGSWTQCDGSTQLWFYNTAPSNSVDVIYDVFWGDGEVSLDLTFASAFEHEYDAEGGYNVTVNAELGFCSNVETFDVFLGSPQTPSSWTFRRWLVSEETWNLNGPT